MVRDELPEEELSEEEVRLNALTSKIIGAAYKVGTALGPGFFEKVYQNALLVELRKVGLLAQDEVEFEIYYEGVPVGKYRADLIVENLVIVEAKAIEALEKIHTAQCINYLKATKKPIALLFNFQARVDVKRIRL